MSARFVVVWLRQTGALFGAGLTAFALGLWSLAHDGSATNFALLAAAATFPGVVLAPVAAGLAERARPRRVLMAANACSVVSTSILALALHDGATPGPWVFGVLVVSGVGFGLQWPVYAKALVRLTTTATERRRAAALLQLGPLAQHIAAPAVAAFAVAAVSTVSVLVVDVVFGVVAVVSSCAVDDVVTVADVPSGAAAASVDGDSAVPTVVKGILTHLGLPAEPLPAVNAQAPPTTVEMFEDL